VIVPPSVRTMLLICSVACWALSIVLISEMIFPQKQAAFSGHFQTSFLFPSLSLVDTALAQSPQPAVVPYAGAFEGPFKTVREARRTASADGATRAAVGPARPKLMLKGILFKSNPLSILQDETGKTFILGIGDTLQGQRVVLIEKTSITLADKHGTYDLAVKE
jgi:hypothetical protein